MILKTFIKRPILASVCSLLIFIAGLICIPLLAVELYPGLAPVQISVYANYVGANSKTVETSVTIPLEEAINGIEDMKYITSTSGNDGSCNINIIFNSTRNPDDALLDVQTRVKEVEARLPNEVKMEGISILKNSSAMVLMYTLTAKDNKYSSEFLSNYATSYIKDFIQRVNGVSRVTVDGDRTYAMRIWLDPYKLSNRGLTVSDITEALSEQNIQVPAGVIGASPNNNNQEFQMNIQINGRISTPKEFEDIIIKSEDNNTIRLKDVARIELGADSYSTISRYNGQESTGLSIYQLPRANALSIAKGVKKVMAELQKSFPKDLELNLVVDSSMLVEESVKEVVFTLICSLILVVLVIYIFLQKIKTTIIPVVTIPISLIGTFCVMKAFNFSINTFTMFGIVLATALVVDDAIIVVENIERFIKNKNLSPEEASLDGIKEIFSAVVATSLVLITIFVPIAFFPGTTGILYRQFAITIACSIFISAFVSVTLTPTMTARLLTKEQKESGLFKKLNTFFEKTLGQYHILLKKVIENSKKVMIVFIILLVLTVILFKVVPNSFIPVEDQAYFTVAIQAPKGISLNRTAEIVNKVTDKMKAYKDIIGIFEFTGFGLSGQSPSEATLYVTLKPLNERKGKKHSAKYIVDSLNMDFNKIPEATVVAFEPPAVEEIGTVGGFQFEIKDNSGHSMEDLYNASQAVVQEANKYSSLTGLFSSFSANTPQIDLNIDKLKAKQMGVSLKDIYDTLQVNLGSMYVNDFNFVNKIYRVYVQADKDYRTNIKDIGRIYVRNSKGDMIPISNFAKYNITYGPDIIQHYNLRPSSEITGSVVSGVSMGKAIKDMEKIAHKVLPGGFSFEWSGLVLEQQESAKKTVLIFSLSFIFVFLILAALYEDLLAPVVIMFSVPLALFGAILFQWIRGLDNDVFCQIGLVMLIGLACKNGILIVEFANQLKIKGVELKKAITKACLIRFRPIIMTSFVCILGIIPLVFASGAGSKSHISMGTAVFGGMILSTILNLFVIPVVYLFVMKIEQKYLTKRKNEK